MINVTKTYIPDIDKYKSYIDQIFASGWLTNNGILTQQLESRLTQYLGVKNLLLVSNGTIALQICYKLLGLKDDVITTPFSFVATVSSLCWEGLNPVFVDIDPETYNIDVEKIESSITSKTTAIVAVHVFGNPCDVEKIEQIAKKYNLKIIYDGAHAFGVNYKNKSVLNYGDLTTLSFHSTKVFHTIEGGAIIINNDQLYKKAKLMINFGIPAPDQVLCLGINAKMNEFQAAMGLCVLDDIEKIYHSRKKVFYFYLNYLNDISLIKFQLIDQQSSNNYGYFPILL
ncbi:MAG: DegT/DnrJ/EryC1/StrS family aminotransferase, partial [Candidatus Sericytochromatia bacterium]|nr:DegT/DnrJ/EryC1/StrS family aminotransferase [Candidatus Sericytochromatia bacterium]